MALRHDVIPANQQPGRPRSYRGHGGVVVAAHPFIWGGASEGTLKGGVSP